MSRTLAVMASLSFLAFALWAGASPAVAAEPIVRAEVSPDVVRVGQALRLRITVLVPTWFSTPPQYPTFEIANAITRLPPNSSYPISKSVGGESWSGVVRDYEIYPLTAALYRIPAQALRVEFVDPSDNRPTAFDGEIRAFEFRAAVPRGAEGLNPFLAGRALELERHVDGDAESLQSGDALVVRTEARLDGMPAIFLPPMTVGSPMTAGGEAAGLGVYPDQPVVEDGELARREESVTYVFEKGGRYSIPGVGLTWWNTETETIEVALLPEIQLAVEGPSLVLSEAIASERTTTLALVGLVAVACLIIIARYRSGYGVAEAMRRRREVWRASEACAFRAVRAAARSGDAARFYENVLQWLERFDPTLSTDELSARAGDEQLAAQLHEVARALFASSDTELDLRETERLLARARRIVRAERKRARPEALPPLNPS